MGSLKIITDLGKLVNFLLETHMSDLGAIQVMERYYNIIVDNNLSRFLRKHAESVKAPNWSFSYSIGLRRNSTMEPCENELSKTIISKSWNNHGIIIENLIKLMIINHEA